MPSPAVRRSRTLALVIVAGLALGAAPAAADWIGSYMPIWVGNSWTFANVDVPGDYFFESVFDTIFYEGHVAVKIGEPTDYQVVTNTGRVITVLAQTEDGALFDLDPNIVIGEFTDGSYFEICVDSPCDTNQIRDWEAIDPALRAIYDLDPAWDDVVLIASYDRDYAPNLQNVVAAANLPPGFPPPAGAVTYLEWYQRGLGPVAMAEVDAASGNLFDFYQLVASSVAVPDQPVPAAAATLAPNYPNPFNPRTVIPYTLARPASVTLEIRDLAGRLVRTLAAAAVQTAGAHTATWDGCAARGRPLPSATYLCRLTAGAEVHARQLTLVR